MRDDNRQWYTTSGYEFRIDPGPQAPPVTISRDGTTWTLHAKGNEAGILHYGDDGCWHFHGQADEATRALFDMLEGWRRAHEGL